MPSNSSNTYYLLTVSASFSSSSKLSFDNWYSILYSLIFNYIFLISNFLYEDIYLMPDIFWMYQHHIPINLQRKQAFIYCKVFLFFLLFQEFLVKVPHLTFFWFQRDLSLRMHILNLYLLIFQRQIWIDILLLKFVFSLFLLILFFFVLPLFIFSQKLLKVIKFTFLLVLLVIFLFFQFLDPQLIFLKPSFLLLFLFLFALKPALLF